MRVGGGPCCLEADWVETLGDREQSGVVGSQWVPSEGRSAACSLPWRELTHRGASLSRFTDRQAEAQRESRMGRSSKLTACLLLLSVVSL